MKLRVSRVDGAAPRLVALWSDFYPYLIVGANGQNHTSGWSEPELIPIAFLEREATLELELVASPPPEGSKVHETISPVRAATTLPVPPNLVRRVRVYSASNAVEADLIPEGAVAMPAGEGLPLPWPFPWSYLRPEKE
jgi:hypothetical protein